jgi:CDP-4-dehydro-6-deoxyglucose reductase, E3
MTAPRHHNPPPRTSNQDEYNVRIEPHARTLRVTADGPVLEAALAAGLNLPHSCKSGHCGSCRARLLSGEAVYLGPAPLGITREETRAGHILLCQAHARSDLSVEARFIAAVADVDSKTLPCRIARLQPLSADVMQVFLRLPAVERLRFHAGQYLDVLLAGGRRRSFSIASPPHDSEVLELHVRRVAGGGFTDQLFGADATLRVGSLLRIEGPLGQFGYRDGPGPVLMIAGGTGFAPLKSMLRHVLENGLERTIHLYWGARHAPDLYEQRQVLEWTERFPQLRFSAVLSQAGAGEAAHTRAGWVHEAVLSDHADLGAFEVYAAGPPAMIEAIRSSFPRHGLAPERLYFDSFDYAPDERRG